MVVPKLRSIKISGVKLARMVDETGLTNETFCQLTGVSRSWLGSKINRPSVSADRGKIEKLADYYRKTVPEMIDELRPDTSRRMSRRDVLRDIPDDLAESFALLAESYGMAPADLMRRFVEADRLVIKE